MSFEDSLPFGRCVKTVTVVEYELPDAPPSEYNSDLYSPRLYRVRIVLDCNPRCALSRKSPTDYGDGVQL